MEIESRKNASVKRQTVVIGFDDPVANCIDLLIKTDVLYLDQPKILARGVGNGTLKNSNDNHQSKDVNTKENEQAICSKCGKETNDLARHAKLHKKCGTVHKCKVCGKEYGSKSHLTQHVIIHADQPSRHVCLICNKGFNYKQNLKNHTRIHTGEKPYHCEVCGSSFTGPSGLRKHKIVHTEGKPICCNTCGKRFSSTFYMQSHIKRMHERKKTERPRLYDDNGYVCETCGKVLCTPFSLRLHLVSHDEKRFHPCKICGKKVVKEGLKGHVLRMHGDRSDRFICPYPGCVRQYASDAGLRYHSLSHSGRRPFPCNLCEKRYRSSGDLKKHKQYHKYWEQAKYRCENCGDTAFRRRRGSKDPEMAKFCIPCKKKVAAKTRAAKKCTKCSATLVKHRTTQSTELCTACDIMEVISNLGAEKCLRCEQFFMQEEITETRTKGVCRSCQNKRLTCNTCGKSDEHTTISCPLKKELLSIHCVKCGKYYYSKDCDAKHNCKFKPPPGWRYVKTKQPANLKIMNDLTPQKKIVEIKEEPDGQTVNEQNSSFLLRVGRSLALVNALRITQPLNIKIP